jgi:hypoxanthine phosphoribosyltransferase
VSVHLLAEPDRIAERVREIGSALAESCSGTTPVFVGVLNGAMPFLADLARATPIDAEVEMLGLTRFGEAGRVSLSIDVSTPLGERDVVLVEDLVDTGLTLRSTLALLEARAPASITVVTLLDRRDRRIVDVPVDHAGFVVGDEFVLGYGMDWEGRYRNLPGLWGVLDLEAFAADPPALEDTGHR